MALLSPPLCRWGNWGLERWRRLSKQDSGGAGAVAQHHLWPLSVPLPPRPAPHLPLLATVPSLFPDLSLELPSHSRTPEWTLGSPWRQQGLSWGHRPINPVSFRGPFPRQRVIDIIISIFLNANYFFSHVNIKIILNVLIKVDVISDHRIINSAWERASFRGENCSLSHSGNSEWFRISSLYDF